jgi:serine/threonine-protein kinase RsbW
MSDPQWPQCEFDRRDLILRLDLEMAADLSAIDPLLGRLMKLIRDMKCAAGQEFEVETALREALANAVIHGCRQDPGKTVQVCVACDESRGMIIVVRDPGEGFDPGEIPSPVVGQNIYASHGRGIYLINQLMDEVHFGRGGTEITMRKR